MWHSNSGYSKIIPEYYWSFGFHSLIPGYIFRISKLGKHSDNRMVIFVKISDHIGFRDHDLVDQTAKLAISCPKITNPCHSTISDRRPFSYSSYIACEVEQMDLKFLRSQISLPRLSFSSLFSSHKVKSDSKILSSPNIFSLSRAYF